MSIVLGRLRRLPLGACIALALVLSVPANGDSSDSGRIGLDRWRPADGGGPQRMSYASLDLSGAHPPPRAPAVLSVFNCNDSGPGSLRAAVEGAIDGDTIDMTQLTCSLITLTSGQITVEVDNLTLRGAPGRLLTIDGSSSNRIFRHPGSGVFALYNLVLDHGNVTSNVGGCIVSYGSVYLNHTIVSDCVSDSSNQDVRGGGVYAEGVVEMQDSLIVRNAARSDTYNVKGGGVYAGFGLIMQDSTIAYNTAASIHEFAFGGGAVAYKYADIRGSSIVGNQSGYPGESSGNIGGIAIVATTGMSSIIANSTIAGNLARNVIGGIYSSTPLTLENTTIALNAAYQNGGPGNYFAGGVHVYEATAYLSSSIIANNTAAGAEYDLSGFGQTISGSHNLIMGSSIAPPDTITADPQLSVWADNGGPTLTMALAATSPAIDAGVDNGLPFDQRGSPFARISGAAADIGAYELQPGSGDRIFANGFD